MQKSILVPTSVARNRTEQSSLTSNERESDLSAITRANTRQNAQTTVPVAPRRNLTSTPVDPVAALTAYQRAPDLSPIADTSPPAVNRDIVKPKIPSGHRKERKSATRVRLQLIWDILDGILQTPSDSVEESLTRIIDLVLCLRKCQENSGYVMRKMKYDNRVLRNVLKAAINRNLISRLEIDGLIEEMKRKYNPKPDVAGETAMVGEDDVGAAEAETAGDEPPEGAVVIVNNQPPRDASRNHPVSDATVNEVIVKGKVIRGCVASGAVSTSAPAEQDERMDAGDPTLVDFPETSSINNQSINIVPPIAAQPISRPPLDAARTLVVKSYPAYQTASGITINGRVVRAGLIGVREVSLPSGDDIPSTIVDGKLEEIMDAVVDADLVLPDHHDETGELVQPISKNEGARDGTSQHKGKKQITPIRLAKSARRAYVVDEPIKKEGESSGRINTASPKTEMEQSFTYPEMEFSGGMASAAKNDGKYPSRRVIMRKAQSERAAIVKPAALSSATSRIPATKKSAAAAPILPELKRRREGSPVYCAIRGRNPTCTMAVMYKGRKVFAPVNSDLRVVFGKDGAVLRDCVNTVGAPLKKRTRTETKSAAPVHAQSAAPVNAQSDSPSSTAAISGGSFERKWDGAYAAWERASKDVAVPSKPMKSHSSRINDCGV
ncbi:hypothetical protein BV898_09680 [Hypsibius exemplaris]|uniref:Uncharacterized protein n=1 Tax=Hypsibius exemplaris TaxID=2072580 RepID=A0A1W0WLW1_HYPEX|nr:hypothetical protein BV898_09680 [Hypsibius exemplaris]